MDVPKMMELTATAGSVGLARAAARSYFADRVPRGTMDMELAVSELVTNAIRHGSGDIGLEFRLNNGQAYIGVHDDGTELPVMREADRASPGGRGLHIVNEISDEWGVYPTAEGKTVWCLIPAHVPTESEGG